MKRSKTKDNSNNKIKSKNQNNKEKKNPILDYILIDNCKQFDDIFNSLKNKEKDKKFLNKKRKNEKIIPDNNLMAIKDIKNEKVKSIIIEEKIKEIKQDIIEKNEEKESKLKEKVNGKIIEKVKEKNDEKDKKGNDDKIFKNRINEILQEQIKQKENKEKNINKNEQKIYLINNNVFEKDKNKINQNKEQKCLSKEKIKEIEKGIINILKIAEMEKLDKNKNSESNQSQIINLSSTHDDEIKLDSFNSQNNILIMDDKEKIDNDDLSKDYTIIRVEENKIDSNEGMKILFGLINNYGLEIILNYLCKDNLNNENEIESKLNLLKNTYGDLKLIFMLLKLNMDMHNEKCFVKKKINEKNIIKNENNSFDFEKIIKNEEFQNKIYLFKNKINELLFADFGFEAKNIDNINNNIIPKLFRDKIHSILKIDGNFQNCISCCDNRKKIDYFCQKCKIPIHPECFTNYHNSHVYNCISNDN